MDVLEILLGRGLQETVDVQVVLSLLLNINNKTYSDSLQQVFFSDTKTNHVLVDLRRVRPRRDEEPRCLAAAAR